MGLAAKDTGTYYHGPEQSQLRGFPVVSQNYREIVPVLLGAMTAGLCFLKGGRGTV